MIAHHPHTMTTPQRLLQNFPDTTNPGPARSWVLSPKCHLQRLRAPLIVKFETQWQNLHPPCGLCMPYGHQPIFYVGEAAAAAVSRDIPNLGPRVSIVDHQGKLIGRFGDTPAGTELGKFLAPHGLAVDFHGDVYVGEVSWTAWPQIYPGRPHPPNLRSLQKFEKVE